MSGMPRDIPRHVQLFLERESLSQDATDLARAEIFLGCQLGRDTVQGQAGILGEHCFPASTDARVACIS